MDGGHGELLVGLFWFTNEKRDLTNRPPGVDCNRLAGLKLVGTAHAR